MTSKIGTRSLLVPAGSDPATMGGPCYWQFIDPSGGRLLALDEGYEFGSFESVILSRNEQRSLYEILKAEFGEST